MDNPIGKDEIIQILMAQPREDSAKAIAFLQVESTKRLDPIVKVDVQQTSMLWLVRQRNSDITGHHILGVRNLLRELAERNKNEILIQVSFFNSDAPRGATFFLDERQNLVGFVVSPMKDEPDSQVSSKTKTRKPVAAKELIEKLEGDEEWVRRHEEGRAKHLEKVEKLRAEMAPEQVPLINELNHVGLNVESVWDLVNTKKSYRAAIPILLKHLTLAKHPILRQGIARALTVREARGLAAPIILRELSRIENDHDARWALANALTVVATQNDVSEIKKFISEERDKGVLACLKRAVKNRE